MSFFLSASFLGLTIFLSNGFLVGHVIFPSWRSFDGKYGHYCDIYDYHYLIDGNVCAWACSLGLIMRFDTTLVFSFWDRFIMAHMGSGAAGLFV